MFVAKIRLGRVRKGETQSWSYFQRVTKYTQSTLLLSLTCEPATGQTSHTYFCSPDPGPWSGKSFKYFLITQIFSDFSNIFGTVKYFFINAVLLNCRQIVPIKLCLLTMGFSGFDGKLWWCFLFERSCFVGRGNVIGISSTCPQDILCYKKQSFTFCKETFAEKFLWIE